MSGSKLAAAARTRRPARDHLLDLKVAEPNVSENKSASTALSNLLFSAETRISGISQR